LASDSLTVHIIVILFSISPTDKTHLSKTNSNNFQMLRHIPLKPFLRSYKCGLLRHFISKLLIPSLS